ncbi:uncharacterized protein LOC126843602 [Adelges cooleyi]|uniref:uncharacterized protein LOC126843602 n=1 Tax=Adelges cooleyi TaxID=133065 RepID=UPI00217F85D0|nr:uncharacterized protein LOC126843602 [Adelges cooleyi]
MRIVEEMTLLKLSPKTIVLILAVLLSLMASCSSPVLSLTTGYGTDENPNTANRYLKCTYLFAGLTYLRLTRLILEDPNVPLRIPIGLGCSYNIRAVICTLYDVTDVEIGSLWLQLLFLCTVPCFIPHNNNGAGLPMARSRMMATLNYVIGRMQKELWTSGCPTGNRFGWYENWYAEQAAFMPSGKPDSDRIQIAVLNICQELNALLIANNAKITYGTRYKALKSRQLFLNNLGVNVNIISMLFNSYGVKVIWYDTIELLQQDWLYAHWKLYSPTNGLFSIKKYYSGIFSLFKGIMYRLTWKHLLYVNELTGQRQEDCLQKWHDLLVEFQQLLRLQDDPDLVNLLVAIDRLGSKDVAVNDVINQLRDNLSMVNAYLQCIATNRMTLEPEEFPSSVNLGTPDLAAIDCNTLKNAQAFFVDLKYFFKKVDFDVIRSIVTYIDDEDTW